MTKRKYTFEQRLEVVMHYFATRLSLIAVSHYHSCDKYRLPQGRWPSAEVWADYS